MIIEFYSVNKKTDSIIKKNSISYFNLDYNVDRNFVNIIKKLVKETINYLETLLLVDIYGFSLKIESFRFLFHLLYIQQHFKPHFFSFFRDILKWFNTKGYLDWKNEIICYKSFKKKEFILNINFKTYKEEGYIRYDCVEDLMEDWGRYKAEKLLSFRKPDDKNKIVEYDQLLSILEKNNI